MDKQQIKALQDHVRFLEDQAHKINKQIDRLKGQLYDLTHEPMPGEWLDDSDLDALSFDFLSAAPATQDPQHLGEQAEPQYLGEQAEPQYLGERAVCAILGFFSLSLREYEKTTHYCTTADADGQLLYDATALTSYLNEVVDCSWTTYNPEMVVKLFLGTLPNSYYPRQLYLDLARYELQGQGMGYRPLDPEAMLRRLMLESADKYPLLRGYSLSDLKDMCRAANIQVEGNLRKRDTWASALCSYISHNMVHIPAIYC